MLNRLFIGVMAFGIGIYFEKELPFSPFAKVE